MSDLDSRAATLLPHVTAADEPRLMRLAARDNLHDFIAHTIPTLPRPRHLRVLTDTCDRVVHGEADRVIISLPPRHLKSITCSVALPAFLLGQQPDYTVALCSYGAELAEEKSSMVRQIVQGDRYPWAGEVKLSEERNALGRWDIAGRRGGLLAVGVGGAITGKGANLVVIDDPFKGYVEASSETERKRVWDWYTGTLYTRLEKPLGAIILVMTRWHEDDIAGRLLSAVGEHVDDWETVILPAVTDDGRELWPEAFDYDRIKANIKQTEGSFAWEAEYQQNPMPLSGNMFAIEKIGGFHIEEERYILPHGEYTLYECPRYVTIDTAFSERESADNTAIGVWAVTPAHDLLLLDVRLIHADETNIVAEMEDVRRTWKPAYFAIEKTGYATRVIKMAIDRGLPVKELRADKDKRTRAIPASILTANGKCFFRRGAAWGPEMKKELAHFPHGKRDDQVDMYSYAVDEMPYVQFPEETGDLPVWSFGAPVTGRYSWSGR